MTQRVEPDLYRVSIGETMDAAMVAEYIKLVGLDVRPTEQTKPFRLRSHNWTLLVETYDWGRVCVATNHLACVVTWVEHLEIPGGVPGWCLALRKRFNGPPCLGHYQAGDQICDGNGKELPCVWRLCCDAIRASASVNRISPEAAVSALGEVDVDALPPPEHRRMSPVLRPAKKISGAEAGTLPSESARKKRRYIPQVGPIKDPYTFTISRQWALETMEQLALGLQRQWAGIESHRCGEGGMYYADRLQNSGHFSIYVRQVGASAIPRCVGWAFPERRTAGVRLQLHAHQEAHVYLRRRLPDSIVVRAWKDGSNVYAVIGLRQDQIGTVVRAIRDLAEEGLWERIDPRLKTRSPMANLRKRKVVNVAS